MSSLELYFKISIPLNKKMRRWVDAELSRTGKESLLNDYPMLVKPLDDEWAPFEYTIDRSNILVIYAEGEWGDHAAAAQFLHRLIVGCGLGLIRYTIVWSSVMEGDTVSGAHIAHQGGVVDYMLKDLLPAHNESLSSDKNIISDIVGTIGNAMANWEFGGELVNSVWDQNSVYIHLPDGRAFRVHVKSAEDV